MTFDPRLLRWLNYAGATVVVLLVTFVGYVSWKANSASYRTPVQPELGKYREYVRIARHAASGNRFADAERAYLDALRLRPGSPAVTLELAAFYEEHGQDRKAAQQYESVADQLVGSPVSGYQAALVRYGALCLRLGERQHAKAVFESACRGYSPTLGSPTDLQAEAYCRVERYDDAIKLAPQRWSTYRSAALARTKEGSAPWLRRFAEAIKRFPNDPTGHAAYAETLWSLRRSSEAFSYLEDAVRFASGKERENLKRLLDELGHRIILEAITVPGRPRGLVGPPIPSGVVQGMPGGMPGGPSGGFGGPAGPVIGMSSSGPRPGGPGGRPKR